VCLSEFLFLTGFHSLYSGINIFAGRPKGQFWFNSNCADTIVGSPGKCNGGVSKVATNSVTGLSG